MLAVDRQPRLPHEKLVGLRPRAIRSQVPRRRRVPAPAALVISESGRSLHMEAITFAGVLGAIGGSFLNVVAYRLPRHESVITPASHCTRLRDAGQALRQHPDPLLAPAARPLPQLRRRRSRRATARRGADRRRCASARCSPTTPLAAIALSIALILIVVPAALIDLEHKIIPNRITALGRRARARDRHSRSTRPASRTA